MKKGRKSSKKETTTIAENGVVIVLSSPEKDSIVENIKNPKNETPLRSIFCLKNMIDMKRIEEKEDCFLLDFNPFNPINIAKLPAVKAGDDADVTVVAENGQVACRDYPHSRHLCLKFPFETTPHDRHCHLCYCYVCDSAAPCETWISHCHASHHVEAWKHERHVKIRKVRTRKS